MRSLIITLLVILAFACLIFAKTIDQYPNYDLAPGVIPSPAAPADDQWDLQYSWDQMEAQTGDNGLLGIAFDDSLVWVSGRGTGPIPPSIYLFEPATGLLVNQIVSGATSSWGIRDMCFDGTYMYGGWESGLICWDITTHAALYTIPIPGGMSFQRANAYNPATDHFYAGNFGSTCYEQDRAGNLIRSWPPAPLSAVYGMAWDDHPDSGGPWLWVHDQTYPSSGCNVHQMDPVTLTYTGFNISLNPPGGSPIAGGLDYAENVVPTHTSMLSFGQGTPDAGAAWEMYVAADLNAPAAPTDFIIEHNEEILTSSLSWVNPALTVGGGTLTDLDGVKVSRSGELIADLTDVAIGEPYEYYDNVPTVGWYDYELMPYNDFGDGIPASEGAWIGLDVPGAPDYIEVIPDPNYLLETTINWGDPASGAHPGAYWPPGSFDSFNIYRALAGNFLVLIASGITGNTYIDNPAMQGWYMYAVSAVNSSGEGPMCEEGPSYVGPPEYLNIPYDWVEINAIGTPSGVTGDDQNLGPFDMGFYFPWYDNVLYSGIRICSNGFLSFTSTSTSYTNYAIPTAAEPNNLVAPFWDDLYPPGGGVIYYYQDTVNNRFIVEFDHVMSYSTPRTPQTFEAIFYPDGIIDFMYNEIQAPCVNASTVGIENSTGTVGVQCTYNGSGPLEPASNTGIRVGGMPPTSIDIVLTPIVTTVPANGGEIEFNAVLSNGNMVIPYIEVWSTAIGPTGTVYGPLIGPVEILDWAAGVAIDVDRIQYVPATAPAGEYTYNGYLGFYPSIIIDEDHFDFTKTTDSGGGRIVHSWGTGGEPFPGEIMDSESAAPSDYELLAAYPNPFNAAANINYVLPERSLVTLVVYDVTGREVAVLVDGWVDSGSHNVIFDGSGLSSGVYFAQFQTSDFRQARKLLLVK